jgi:uncharacterized protein (TIGR00297 family)
MISLLAAATFAALGWRLGWLTRSGTIAACLIGTAVLNFGGIRWAAVLLAFVATGSVLTLAGRSRKTQPEHRGGGRSAVQVVATGGVAAAVSVVWGLDLGPEALRALLPAAFLGSVAAAAADTWATELGMLAGGEPRLITTGRRVPPGISGGVTLRGSGAGLGGAWLIALVGAWGDHRLIVAVLAAGVLAMLFDSVLGATVQASYRRLDGALIEEPEGGATLMRGVPWINNPMVNFLATIFGAAAAAALAVFLRRA